jgi:hypothetical protein
MSQRMSSRDIIVVVFGESEHNEPEKNDKKTVGDIIEAYILCVDSSGNYAWIVNPNPPLLSSS